MGLIILLCCALNIVPSHIVSVRPYQLVSKSESMPNPGTLDLTVKKRGAYTSEPFYTARKRGAYTSEPFYKMKYVTTKFCNYVAY